MAEKKYIIDNPDLMAEWDWEKNNELGLDPHKLTEGSGKKAWWKCSKGHSSNAVIQSRNNGYGCPICAGKCVIQGVNDLLSVNAILCQEWDFEKNKEILPSMVAIGSDKKVWWKCDKCNHSWQASVSHRNQGRGCPVCAGKQVVKGFNDFATLFPNLICEWNYEKNIDLSPFEVTAHSHKKVWWKCSKCSNEWLALISSRARGFGCPKCGRIKAQENKNKKFLIKNGSLLTNNPALASEWCFEKNAPLLPSHFAENSHSKVWWKCQKCGNIWQAQIKSRNCGTGCPVCAKRDILAKRTNDTKSETQKETVFKSGKSRQTSFPEQAIYYYVFQSYPDAVNRCVNVLNNGLELDVFIPSIKIAIEYDGIAWHQNEVTYEREKRKYDDCKKRGITLIRVKENHEHDKGDTCDILLFVSNRLDDTIKQLSSYLNIPIDIDTQRDEIKIKEQYYGELKNNSISVKNPELVKEWHPIKNGKLTPEMYSPHSSQKVWWRCLHGHEWQATISSRSSGCGCPFCSGRKALRGVNDLSTTHPEIAKEWHHELNNNLSPNEVLAGSNKRVWWKCEHCGLEWRARVEERTKGKKCPNCYTKL